MSALMSVQTFRNKSNKIYFLNNICINNIYIYLGARVILACRNMEMANKAVEDIKNNPPSR